MEKYMEDIGGIEYVIYAQPLRMRKTDVVPKYTEGGAVFYRDTKYRNQIKIVGHIKYKERWDKETYEMIVRRNDALKDLLSCRMEVLAPVREMVLYEESPQIMSSRHFYREKLEEVREYADVCVKLYDADKEDIQVYYEEDSRNAGVILYGYGIHELPRGDRRRLARPCDCMSLAQYEKRAQHYYRSEYERHLARGEKGKKKDAVAEGELTRNFREEAKQMPLVYQLREWLQNVSYVEFENCILDRVKGQTEVSRIIANVYYYLSCIANGKKHQSNMLIAAPSGCGKTETYRAIQEYFEEKIPKLKIYQVDVSNITEEGYKGKSPISIFTPFFEDKDESGIGIVFLDEFDKKLIPSGDDSRNMNAAVQAQLLTMLEGCIVREDRAKDKSGKVDSRNTMFIGLGAFDMCRKNRVKKEKSIGFGAKLEKEETPHYDEITREDMINIGASYELLGRFGTIVNYDVLSEEIVDQIIDRMVETEGQSFDCEVRMMPQMREDLHKHANSKFGCRSFASVIHDTMLDGYMQLLKLGEDAENYVIVLDQEGKAHLERGEGKTVADNLGFEVEMMYL